MSVQSVLLPVFCLVGLTFALLIGMAFSRRNALVSRETKIRDIALGEPKWPVRATQIGNCYANQFELPVLFYVLTIQISRRATKPLVPYEPTSPHVLSIPAPFLQGQKQGPQPYPPSPL